MRGVAATGLLFALAFAPSVPCQERPRAPSNLGFEESPAGEAPSGWRVPEASVTAGYVVKVAEGGSFSGSRHVTVASTKGAASQGFGNVMQSIDATPHRGKVVRLRGAARIVGASPAARAQFWLRVDRPGGQPGFFDNMNDRPVMGTDWSEHEIVGLVAADAESINFGAMLIGEGTAAFDAVKLDFQDAVVPAAEGPRASSAGGLESLVAAAHLIGYVRFFHPSDEAASADWDAFAIDAVRRVERAETPAERASALESIFRPIAPTLRVAATGASVTDAFDLSVQPAGATRVLVWRHAGIQLGPRDPGSPYRSERVDVLSRKDRLRADPQGVIGMMVPAARLVGSKLAIRAMLRTEAAGAPMKAGLWVSVLGESSQMLFTDQGEEHPIASSEWTGVEVLAPIPPGSKLLTFGLVGRGQGRAFIDTVTVQPREGDPPPEALRFTNLGFEDGLQTAGESPRGWEVEKLGTRPDRGWRAGVSATRPHSGARCAMVESVSLDPERFPDPAKPLIADLGGGVTCRMPLALPADASGTLPHAAGGSKGGAVDALARLTRTGKDRATRLAGVMLAWTALQHFYPYFDVVGTDWEAQLRRALAAAATDADEAAFSRTLSRLASALHDGHAWVWGPADDRTASLPLAWDWIEGRLVVTAVDPSRARGVARGDVVAAIDGRPAGALLADAEALVSGASPGWLRYRALREISSVPPGREVVLDVIADDGATRP